MEKIKGVLSNVSLWLIGMVWVVSLGWDPQDSFLSGDTLMAKLSPDWSQSGFNMLLHCRFILIYLSVAYLLIYQLSFIADSIIAKLRFEYLFKLCAVLYAVLPLMQIDSWIRFRGFFNDPFALTGLACAFTLICWLLFEYILSERGALTKEEKVVYVLPLALLVITPSMGLTFATLPWMAGVVSLLIAVTYFLANKYGRSTLISKDKHIT
jgi:hypothetical protein